MKHNPLVNWVCLTSVILVFNYRFNNHLAPLVQLKYNLAYIIQFFRAVHFIKWGTPILHEWQCGGKAWLPFIFLPGNLKIGIKNFILDLNRTQMFSEQLLKMTGALQRRCLTVSVSSGTSGKNRWDQYVIILEFKQHGLVF